MKFSLKEKVLNCLRHHQRPMKAQEIASWIVETYPEDVQAKANRKQSDTPITDQIRAEIGAQKQSLQEAGVAWTEDRPRAYYLGVLKPLMAPQEEKTREADLYPKLIQFLREELGTYAKRIDEKRSKNNHGRGGNKYLHPDVVGLSVKGADWDPKVQNLAKHLGQPYEVLSSFEVKIELNRANVRECYLQAVANSSWAHEGYLVAVELIDGCMEELRLLHGQFGIGVLHLNPADPGESIVILPAKVKESVGMETVNRIYQENADFRDYITLIEEYRLTGNLKPRDW